MKILASKLHFLYKKGRYVVLSVQKLLLFSSEEVNFVRIIALI